jgi:hypothetical protein
MLKRLGLFVTAKQNDLTMEVLAIILLAPYFIPTMVGRLIFA